jgi:hypothetical protein
MTGKDFTIHGERRLGKGNQVADADKALNLAGEQAGIHPQVLQRYGFLTDIRRQKVRCRLHHDRRTILATVNRDKLTRQHTPIHPADIGDAQEAIHDSGHHQPDGIHVGRQEQARGGWVSAPGAAQQPMQAAQAADLKLIC